MGIFRSAKRSASRGSTRGPKDRQPNVSILAAGARLTGSVVADGVLQIAGEIDGDLSAQGQVLVAPGGVVEGDIRTRHAIVGGEVNGRILADQLVELRDGGVVRGDIVTPRISVEEGGTLNGYLRTASPPASAHKLFGSEPPPTHPASRYSLGDQAEASPHPDVDRIRPAS